MTRLAVVGNLWGLGEKIARVAHADLIEDLSPLHYRTLLKADIIVSLSARLSARVFFPLTKFKPYIALATGSDLTELPAEDNSRGARARAYFRRARFTTLVNFDLPMRLAARLYCNETYNHKFWIEDAPGRPDEFALNQVRTHRAGHFTAYLPACQDWHTTGRPKGNEVALRALAAMPDVRVIARDEGVNIAEAKRILPNALWLPRVSQSTLRAIVREVDVVLDQFENSVLGLVGLETMYEGKPLITKWDEPEPGFYPSRPPIFLADTVRGIQTAISQVGGWGAEYAHSGAAWVRKYHGREQMERFVAAVITEAERKEAA